TTSAAITSATSTTAASTAVTTITALSSKTSASTRTTVSTASIAVSGFLTVHPCHDLGFLFGLLPQRTEREILGQDISRASD
ncbi:hypothetical protein PanWU01x14_300400, partial [Parasponia andersonii]